MRVHRCFAFLDISGFTALTHVQGDEQAVEVLDSFRSLLREICSRRAVRIAKWLGDGAMLVSVETLPVLESVLEVQFAARRAQRHLAVRAGVVGGDVILYEGDDYIGHAVNMAARLCEVAAAGQVLGEPDLSGALPGWGMVLDVDELELRGIGRPIRVAHLGLRPLLPPTEMDPVCGIPLVPEVAAAVARDASGIECLFCSASCRDTWERRPPPPPEEHGSLRSPLIGS